MKDRTFLMASYEGIRSIQQTVTTTSVLTAAERTGDFSAYSGTLRNPYTSTTYANKQIPVNAVAQGIVNTYMPLPNVAGTSNGTLNNYSGVQTGNQSNNQYIARIDHRFNDRNQFALHYLYQGRSFPLVSTNPNFSYTGNYLINNAGLQYIHVFSPSIVNEFRGGTDLEHVKQLPVGYYNGLFTAAQIGINQFTLNGAALPPPQEGFPTLSISSFLSMGSGTAASNLDNSRTYQATDNLTGRVAGNSLLMGADIRYILDNATTNNTPFGSMSFTGSYTGFAAADYMLGVPATVITPEGVPLTAARQWRYGVYVQDDWNRRTS